jgi:hypothetical protein
VSGEGKNKRDGESVIGDVLKKVISVGVGAAFMTEDMVKNVLGDLPLPKDIVSGLVQNAKNSKEEFVTSMREEVGGYLKKIDMKKLIVELLENYDVEVNAKVKFNKKNKKK